MTRLRRIRQQPMVRVGWRGRALEPYRRRQFAAFGERSIVHRPLWLYGTRHIAVGAHVLVLPGGWMAVEEAAWGSREPVLTIGDRVGIRPYVTLSASERITIEDDVIIAAYSSLIDSDHTWDAGRPNVMANPTVTAPIHVGRGTWIGERVAVLRGARIGAGCVIGANSVVRGDIPDGSVAVGAPARVVGRSGYLG